MIEVWPLRLEEPLARVLKSGIATSSSKTSLMGRLWFRCCFRELWLFRGAARLGPCGPERALGADSKLAEGAVDCWLAGNTVKGDRDLPGFDGPELMVFRRRPIGSLAGDYGLLQGMHDNMQRNSRPTTIEDIVLLDVESRYPRTTEVGDDCWPRPTSCSRLSSFGDWVEEL